MMNELKKYELSEHLIELRTRLSLCVITFIIATSICYLYSDYIFNFLTKPLVGIYGEDSSRRMIYTSMGEAFLTYFKIAYYAGFILAFPFIAFQLYFFIAPALYKKEKITLIPFLIFIPILFCLGAALVYYFIIPKAWEFFLSFENKGNNNNLPIILEAKISAYLNLILDLILGFGVAFQLPLILALLAKVGVVKGNWLAEKRKYAVIGIFIIAAILTPPDVISQIALALPLLLLYEISIVICKSIRKN